MLGRTIHWMTIAIVAAGVAGCASSPETIATASVSQIGYQAYTCAQLGAEGTRVSNRLGEVARLQKEQAEKDAFAAGVAIVVFTPAALFIQGNTANAAELSRLKGEFEAIEMVAATKNCNVQIPRPVLPPPNKSASPTVAQAMDNSVR